MEIGAKIRNARKEAGLTQEQAAEALGVSRQTVSNWENERSYPDIVSVIRMSDLYSVSLDRLLKEETPVKQTYLDYLEDSTNVVKSKKRLTRTIAAAAVLLVWAAAQAVLWLAAKGPVAEPCGIALRGVLLPAAAAVFSLAAAKNDYWGRGRWLLVPIFAVLFLLTPYSAYADSGAAASFRFTWPNLRYMPVGALASLTGLGIGTLLGSRGRHAG